jgi:signal transduction histidine kinase/ActR/RegA family two-component response regulator
MPKKATDVPLRRIRHPRAKLLAAPQGSPASRRRNADARTTNDEYRELYLTSPIPALSIGSDYAIQRFNDAACVLLNESPAGLLARGFREFVQAEDRRMLSQRIARAKTEGIPDTFQVNLSPRGGEPIPVRIWLRHSKIKRVSELWLVDLRAQQQANEQAVRLAESERIAREESAAKDRFIAVLSHELRTPLTPVLATASAFRAQALPRELRDAFEMIERNVGAEARLIDDLLDVNRIVRGRMRVEREPSDVHAIMREALATLREEAAARHHVVRVSLDAPQHHASVDPLRLRQVFVNLIRNAIKYTPERGDIRVSSWNGKGSVALEVSDNGIGIEPTRISALFEPFTQEETSVSGGLGLGLAVAKGLIALHDGRISAHSRGLGHGSRFVVELSLIDAELADEARAKETPSSRPPPRLDAEHPRILLVEDHADTVAVLTELLEANGYEVKSAMSLREAREVDLAKIDLIVSDLGLPDGTGLELMRELRERVALPAIALSGFGMQSDLKTSKEAGFDLHLTKPVNIDRLLEAIESLSATEDDPGSAGRGSSPFH